MFINLVKVNLHTENNLDKVLLESQTDEISFKI